jgi:hypothetical protein
MKASKALPDASTPKHANAAVKHKVGTIEFIFLGVDGVLAFGMGCWAWWLVFGICGV